MNATSIYVVLLFLAGLILAFFEFLMPTFGVLAFLSLVSLGGSIFLAFTVSAGWGWLMVVLTAIGVPVYIGLLIKLWPNSRLGKKLFLLHTPVATADASPQGSKYVGLVGKVAVAESVLRPSGVIRVEGQRVPAQCESGMIDPGQRVKIIGANLGIVVVRREE